MGEVSDAGAHRLRPMDVLQILDASVRMYRENFFSFLGISLIPTAPFHLTMLAATQFLYRTTALSETAPGQPPTFDEMTGFVVACGIMMIILLLQMGIAMPIATGALTTAVSGRYLGRPVTVAEAYRPLRRMIWPYLGTSLLLTLLYGLGSLTLYILLAVFWTWYMCTPCVMVVEGVTGLAAMRRSRHLADGHYGRILGASIVLFLVYMVLNGALPQVLNLLLTSRTESPALAMAISQGVAMVITVILDPLWSILRIMFYYDLRIRKEGLDLAIASQRLAAEPPLA